MDAQLRDELDKGFNYFSPLDEFKSMEFMKEYATGILDYFGHALAERGMSVKQALHESIAGVVGIMNPLYSHIDPSKVGSYRRALSEGEEYARRLLESTKHPNAEELAEHLVWDYPAHDFVIDYQEAEAIGLPVQRMPITHEKMLINSLTGLMNNDIPFMGFAKPAIGKKPATKSSRRKLPVPVETPGTGNGARRASA